MSIYFKPTTINYFSTGSTLLDCAIGGGWAEGRVINIVGDQAVGKSLLAEEACGEHLKKYPDKSYRDYVEPESAIDGSYLEAMGIPSDKINFLRYRTVENWYDHYNLILSERNSSTHSLYIIDSLDSLSDEAELEREIEKGSYKTDKPKLIGEIFRRLNQTAERKNVTLMIISQTRDKIGSLFPQKTRSGGNALNFYASQILWISQVAELKRTSGGIERTYGITIKVKVKKNKTGRPYREVELDLLFERGIDDIASNLKWLSKVKDGLTKVPKVNNTLCSKENLTVFSKKIWSLPQEEFDKYRSEISVITKSAWEDVEKLFDPPPAKKHNFKPPLIPSNVPIQEVSPVNPTEDDLTTTPGPESEPEIAITSDASK